MDESTKLNPLLLIREQTQKETRKRQALNYFIRNSR